MAVCSRCEFWCHTSVRCDGRGEGQDMYSSSEAQGGWNGFLAGHCLALDALCLRLLPAQQPELGGGWRGTGLVCAAVLTQSSVQLEQWGPGDQSGSTQGVMCGLDFSTCASDSMDWVCWALDWGFGVCEWALM